MAAKSTDSKRIFDLYIEKYLNEQLAGLPQAGQGSYNYDASSKPKEDEKEKAETKSTSDAGRSSIAAAAGMAGVNPYIFQPQQISTTQTPDASQVGAGGYGAAAQPAQANASSNQGPLDITVKGASSQAPIQSTTSPALATAAQPAGSATKEATPASSTQPQVATGEPSAKEKELLKKFHASEYNAGSKTDQARLQELRTAAAALGGDLDKIDTEKLRNLSYAQQYKDSAQGQAYAKRAGEDYGKLATVNVPKPGEVKPTTPTPASTTPSNYAQQFVSPETQQLLSQKQQSSTGSQTSTAQTDSKPGLQPSVAALIDQLNNLPPEVKSELKKALG